MIPKLSTIRSPGTLITRIIFSSVKFIRMIQFLHEIKSHIVDNDWRKLSAVTLKLREGNLFRIISELVEVNSHGVIT